MIDRRLALLLLAATGLGSYAAWSGNNTLLTWLDPREEIVTASQQSTPVTSPEAKPQKVANLNPLAQLALAQFEDITKRPLFNPTRAPAPPPPEPEPEVEEVAVEAPPPVEEVTNPDDFALLGIASKDGTWTVIMRWNPSNEIHRLKTGGEIQGWSVAEVTLQKVTLSRDGKTMDIKMFQNLASRPAQNLNPEDPSVDPELVQDEDAQQQLQMNARQHQMQNQQ